MQSIFRLPWCSERVGPKLPDAAALEKMCASPVVDIPVLHKLKRKRATTSDSLSTPSPLARASTVKKARPEEDARWPAVGCGGGGDGGGGGGSTEHASAHHHQKPAPAASAASAALLQAADILHPPAPPMWPPGASHNPNHSSGAPNTPIVECEAVASTSTNDAATMADGDAHFTPLQQVISNELNVQILMKHNELRLIEQELAKCQVALEQLRRCELRPFPGHDRPSESVTAGAGAAIAPPPGCARACHPAPHGVTDGPYTRHYRQWLLHDPRFDAVCESTPWADTGAHTAGRATRNNGTARKSVSKPFAFPPGRAAAEPLHSIPNYPAVPPRDKTAPLVLRRSTDGRLVKLMCNNCQRGNFSSIQGFLNHCRIAHKVDYKSHDAAAIDCGRPLDDDEAASIPTETHTTPAPKPTTAASRTSTAASTPHRGLVHPFNTTAGASLPFNSSDRRSSDTVRAVPSGVPKLNPAPHPGMHPSPLNPSAQLPRLSAHFAKYRLGGDLAAAAASAKQKIEILSEEDVASPDASEHGSPIELIAGARKVAGSRPGMSSTGGDGGGASRPPSRKGFRHAASQRPRPSPLVPSALNPAQHHGGGEIPESPLGHHHASSSSSPSNLSPHGIDSNPGLVSDHEEDDDHVSASEEEEAPHETDIRPHPIPVVGAGAGGGGGAGGGVRTCSDNMDLDVSVSDDDSGGGGVDHHGVIIRRNSMTGPAAHRAGLRGSGGAAGGSPSRKLGGGGGGKRGK